MEEEEAGRRQVFRAGAQDWRLRAYMSVSRLVAFADWDFYYVDGNELLWRPNTGSHPEPVVVPAGFVSDLASIPRAFWQILQPTGRHAWAAVVHDYLYWTQTRSREESDLIFKMALEDSRVDPATVEVLYQAVRRFGQSSWEENARKKQAGDCRFLKARPGDFTVSWSDWKKMPAVLNCDQQGMR
jgi:hypothetical protein